MFRVGDLHTHLSNLEQCLSAPTRMQKILDLCYGNIPNTYIHVFRRKAKLVKINYKNKAEKKMNL